MSDSRGRYHTIDPLEIFWKMATLKFYSKKSDVILMFVIVTVKSVHFLRPNSRKQTYRWDFLDVVAILTNLNFEAIWIQWPSGIDVFYRHVEYLHHSHQWSELKNWRWTKIQWAKDLVGFLWHIWWIPKNIEKVLNIISLSTCWIFLNHFMFALESLRPQNFLMKRMGCPASW